MQRRFPDDRIAFWPGVEVGTTRGVAFRDICNLKKVVPGKVPDSDDGLIANLVSFRSIELGAGYADRHGLKHSVEEERRHARE